MRVSRPILIGGILVLAVTLGVVLPLVLSSSGRHHASRVAPSAPNAQARKSSSNTGSSSARRGKGPAPLRVSGATAGVKAGTPPPRSRRRKRARATYWIPWRPNGTSTVARTRGRWLAVYRRPRAPRAAVLLRNPDEIGTARVLLVHSEHNKWIRVYLPTRPNGVTGWAKRGSVLLLRNPYRIVVRRRSHHLALWKGQRVVLHAKTVIGTPSTPTPLGLYYVVDLLRPPDPRGSYGPFTFDLSAHSNVLKRFAGGDGHVAIHGTNQPWLLGQSVSHGCVRVSNSVIRRLARVLPLGTPVLIRR